ncbi:electron transport complex subunit RsxC [bacterium]|nr:electron transport complex subunit RsxC [bacterium]
MAYTFIGGIHPLEEKRYCCDAPIQPLEPPQVVYVPLSQHIGAPARCLVKKGDRVLLGQKIGEASGFVSSAVHASVSGKVKAIELHLHPVSGKLETMVIIENDGLDEAAAEIKPHGEDWESATPEEIRDIVASAGIVGMGGATFPAHVKLSPPKDKIIDTVLLNGAECEPYLTADHRLMLEFSNDIIRGLILIAKTLGAGKLGICVENNKPDAIKILQERAKDTNIKIYPMKVKYPQGAEKQMIYAVTGREVPSGGLPFDCGCYVQNVGTSKAIYDAVAKGTTLYQRVVTVTGPILKAPANLMVRVGTLYSDLVKACGGTTEDIFKVISGGPMMGIAQATLDVPVTKGTSGVLLFGSEDVEIKPEIACINCAKCVDACPSFLIPTRIAQYTEYGDFEMAEKLGALDCIECGSCAFVCPSDRKLLQYIRRAKTQIKADKATQK